MTPDAALRLAVVGHTNTGKTSLLRTLTRDPEFGEVRDNPGTTRKVQGAHLLADGQRLATLYDTPGLEDASALLDYLDTLIKPGERPDGPERLNRFLDSPESRRRFEQETRVLRQLLDSDAALYVIDARDPVLGKHRDELQLLAYAGKPLLPILNFTHTPQSRLPAWREALRRLGLHVLVEFDTIAPPLDGQSSLYERLALLLETSAHKLQALRDALRREDQRRRQDALRLIAELLIDAAAWRVHCAADQPALEAATQTLRERLRQREQRCVDALLQCHHFDSRSYPAHSLPLQGERWGMDLFHPQALKNLGIHVGKGMAAGAMTGATVDAFLAGVSLGAATLAGAAIGGLWQGADKLGKRLLGRLRGWRELSVDDSVLRLLALRQLTLLQALERRGHAAQTPIVLDAGTQAENRSAAAAPTHHSTTLSVPPNAARWQRGPLPATLLAARAQPSWSTLSSEYRSSPAREAAVQALADTLPNLDDRETDTNAVNPE